MIQQEIEYFWPLTQQIALDLDYTPCLKHAEEKLQQSVRNSVVYTNSVLTCGSNGDITWAPMVNPSIVVYPDKTPITIRTEKKPSILARWVYKILGAKWERAC